MNKNKCAPSVAACVLLSAVFALSSPGVGAAEKSGSSIQIQQGIVIAAEATNLQSAAGKGAALGGAVGYYTAKDKSRSKRWRNSAIGAAAGGGATRAAEGNLDGMAYTVQTASGGVIRIVSDQTQISVGDCVTVEQAGDGATNIRRSPPALCEVPADQLDADIQEDLVEEAADCLEAKRQMLDAQTDADMERALRKVQILCDM